MNQGKQPDSIIEILRSVILESYGWSGVLTRLPGENLNYLLGTDSGRKFIAKLAGQDSPAEVVDMEYAALEHASKSNLNLELPSIVKNYNKQKETRIKIPYKSDKRLRILNYVGGTNLSDLSINFDISDGFRHNLGQSLAQFDVQMARFDHPAAHRAHRWDLANAGQHQPKAALIEDQQQRELLNWAFDQYANNISPILTELPWQFIHGDCNPENIRVSGAQVTGLVDFGDSCHNPTVCELAICLAYQMMDVPNPLAVAEQVIAGYESIRPLSGNERRILLPLACSRLAVSIAVATERRSIDAGNDNWFVTEAPAWRLLAWFKVNS